MDIITALFSQDSRYSGRRDRDPRSGDRPPPVDRYRDYDRDRRSRRRSVTATTVMDNTGAMYNAIP